MFACAVSLVTYPATCAVGYALGVHSGRQREAELAPPVDTVEVLERCVLDFQVATSLYAEAACGEQTALRQLAACRGVELPTPTEGWCRP